MATPDLKSKRGSGARQARDADIVRDLCAWFQRSRRDLPWRPANGQKRDPYASLVSEVMLQQTQVSRVVERFTTFLTRFPTVQTLASGAEEEVLALWSGLGYYRRAKSLHAAARAVVEDHGGQVPRDVKLLRELPGIGRYTAGAIASIVFGDAEATVDGNVARVLLRLEGRELPQDEGVRWAWGRAKQLVGATNRGCAAAGPGILNEALMELGAVICIPRGAKCDICPVRPLCRAARKSRQEQIPTPKSRPSRRVMWCDAVVLKDQQGRVLMEQRGQKGMWAGMWQVVTVEGEQAMNSETIETMLGVRGLVHVAEFVHVTTHRDVQFRVWLRQGIDRNEASQILKRREGAVWRRASELASLGISSAQRKVLASTQPQAPPALPPGPKPRRPRAD